MNYSKEMLGIFIILKRKINGTVRVLGSEQNLMKFYIIFTIKVSVLEIIYHVNSFLFNFK